MQRGVIPVGVPQLVLPAGDEAGEAAPRRRRALMEVLALVLAQRVLRRRLSGSEWVCGWWALFGGELVGWRAFLSPGICLWIARRLWTRDLEL
jgi:hypothetical protein